jgi:multiple sugar transport system ATP-binding protein
LCQCPNSIFVAGFIGSPRMNFPTGAFAAAERCTTLGIRSEHIDVAGVWQGGMVHGEDLGSDNYLFVAVGSDEPLIVRQEGKLAVKPGAKVGLDPKA